MAVELPPRYELVTQLGKGGGGEVYLVRDRLSDERLALKTLAAGADREEAAALLREASVLGGLSGLGVPLVRRFGRLPESGRPYLVRELAEGGSLLAMLDDPAEAQRGIAALVGVADKLTLLHRAAILHGDIKPANIIVAPSGEATLVDLGLSAALRDGGQRAEGLTPRYAAPELLAGGRLGVRAEIFALGRTLADLLRAAGHQLDAEQRSRVEAVAERATREAPEARFPSADEFAHALRDALGDAAPDAKATDIAQAWPVLGLDALAASLLSAVRALQPGAGIVVTGPHGSGKSTLLRRLGWELGMAGAPVAVVDATQDLARTLSLELGGLHEAHGMVLLVDDAHALPREAASLFEALREQGAKLCVAAAPDAEIPALETTLSVFEMPELDPALAREIVRRIAPGLGDAAVLAVLERAAHRPGAIRAALARIGSAPITSAEGVREILASESVIPKSEGAMATLLELRQALLRGHFEEAAELIATRDSDSSFEFAVLRAKLWTNQGRVREALSVLAPREAELGVVSPLMGAEYLVELARAQLRAGDYAACERAASELALLPGATYGDAADPLLVTALAEGLALGGMAASFLGRHDESLARHERSIVCAREVGAPRVLSVALSSAAFSLQRQGKLDQAEPAYEEALGHAERAGDAGTVATTRLNLAAIAKNRGDLARTIEHLEAAVDMGRRSGRRATLRQALLNLANLDLYLGRHGRAEQAIKELAAERAELPKSFAAQLTSLEAELSVRAGDRVKAHQLCIQTAEAYDALGRPIDAAEARLEAVFASLGTSSEQPVRPLDELERLVDEAAAALAGTDAHRAATELARSRLFALRGDTKQALSAADRAETAASTSGKRDWSVKVHRHKSELLAEEGQQLLSRKEREAALMIMEEIARRLPRDLREVFWDDGERRKLRVADTSLHRTVSSAQSTITRNVMPDAPAEIGDRLARVLEINRQIAGTHDLRTLTERVTDHAISLLSAERGFVILKSQRAAADGDLSVFASRDQHGDDPHARFSQSIADRVISSGEPIVTRSAREDASMADYVSVHQLSLQSVACVPIRSRTRGVIGALYLETRLGQKAGFQRDLPLISAFADQVAIAIETASLIQENKRRADELEEANRDLTAARAKLEELLGHRTEQLQQTRRDLRSARAVLKSHFGYQGLVGTSNAMRRVYALIERVKDTDIPVLLTGESGTGKEVVAKAIHQASPRGKQPFLAINCGAIPENLLESELFGHVRGAFTGADRDRKGLFREASQGTLLLDEIGEMPPKMQAGLLRVLQERLVRPVGGAREEPVETRIIAATHRDLEQMVAESSFREDLFYRLNVIQIRIPPLRERPEDIPLLVDYFLGIFAARYGRPRRNLSRAAQKWLTTHRWPGNVRQLEHALLNAWVLSDGPELEPEDFELSEPVVDPRRAARESQLPVAASIDDHRSSERERILQALSDANWNRVKAAEIVGIPRRTFYRRLKEYGIQ